jgi:hypothetical protein
MFKTIGRIMIILLVAAIVAGGLYALVQNGSASSTAFTPDRQFANRNTTGTSAPPEQFREHESEGGFSLGRGLGGILVTALQIGVITVLVLQAQRVLAKPASSRGERV